jgi:hypothetical protein
MLCCYTEYNYDDSWGDDSQEHRSTKALALAGVIGTGKAFCATIQNGSF